jgi:DNA-binding IclR family transcriptional regulator
MLQVLGRKYSLEILEATDSPRSAQELSDRLDIPTATCYRRVDELTDAGLLEHAGDALSDERRRVEVYERTVTELTVTFRDRTATIAVSREAE